MLIDGKAIADKILLEIQDKIGSLSHRPPCLAVIQVGHHPASKIYVKRKIEACKRVGISSISIQLPHETSEIELIYTISKLNSDESIDGVLIQLPLPEKMNPLKIAESVSPNKDIDGLHPLNIGRLLIGQKTGFVPCTPLAVRVLLARSSIEVSGKHVAILGRSLIVGRPLAALLMQNSDEGNATVTLLHSRSENLEDLCKKADIVVVAVGKAGFLKKEMVKQKAVVIDVGINRIDDPTKPQGYRIVGDADFDSLKEHCHAITPVPGGVGPMTIAMLLSNTLESCLRHFK